MGKSKAASNKGGDDAPEAEGGAAAATGLVSRLTSRLPAFLRKEVPVTADEEEEAYYEEEALDVIIDREGNDSDTNVEACVTFARRAPVRTPHALLHCTR